MHPTDVVPAEEARAPRRGREGSALLLTVSFVMLTGIVTGALISAAVTHRRMADRSYQRERAFNIAEAGLEAACQIVSFRGDLLPDPYITNGTLNGGNWYCTIDRTSTFTYALSSTGIVNNVKWVVQARRVEQPSWAKYALWMDINGSIYFIGGETFNGHVHSNTQIYFDNPGGDGADFLDRLTSATNTYGGTTNNATFAYGLELNADQDSMANVNFTDLYNTAVSAGYVVTGHTTVVLTGTTMRVTNQRKGWTNFSITVGTNNIMYVKTTTSGTSTNMEGRLMISGKLDGRITFVTEEDVMLRGNLTYANNPTNSGADDAIGLVSKDAPEGEPQLIPTSSTSGTTRMAWRRSGDSRGGSPRCRAGSSPRPARLWARAPPRDGGGGPPAPRSAAGRRAGTARRR